MKITNKFGVPETLVSLARSDYYSKGAAQYSVTELISPPRVQRLRKKHWEDMTQDVSDMLWQMCGSALHVIGERGQAEGHINEERLFGEIAGSTLSGAIDLQQDTPDGVILMDYKFTSAWAVMNNKPDWEYQLNCYAWLVRKAKAKPVAGLKVVALVRDWNRREAGVKPGYPKAPIHMVDIPLWTQEKAEAYLIERIGLHDEGKTAIDLDGDLPLCSDEDRWSKPTVYAVKKEGRKTAVKLYSNELEAVNHAKEEKHYVEIRRGEPIRCTGNFCGVAQWCSQYREENAASHEGSGIRPEGREE